MFHSPYWLALLLILPPLAWRMWHGGGDSIEFSSVVGGIELPKTWRQRLAWLPRVCQLAALALAIIALARPREGREQTVIESEGIAIELVVDRSSSMQARDFRINGRRVDRLTAVKQVAGRFIAGDAGRGYGAGSGELEGRTSDLVGLVAFAGFADGVTPPTLDHRFLIDRLESVRIVNSRREDGTAIGDALALAVEKLDALDRRQTDKIRSKVVILLTDGENTAGEVEPVQAAEMAGTIGIKVYTIGVGTRGVAPVPIQDPFTGRIVYRNLRVNIDESTLREIAAATGGAYFRATDTESLESIYRAIDQLEKTKVESKSFVDYRELAVQPARVGGYWLPPLLLIALLLIASALLLQHTIFRTFP